jgi:uncharacterized NAD-dependent epimerase/dehydratase family protein
MKDKNVLDGNAIVYCEGAYNTPCGKTAHGLVRYTKRYNVIAVIDSVYDGKDAGIILDGRDKGIPVVSSLNRALEIAKLKDLVPSYFVIGIAPDGGNITDEMLVAVKQAISEKLNVDSGLHNFLSDMSEVTEAAERNGVTLRDIRKVSHENSCHFFSGVINEVKSLKIAMLGTDSAVGKRTTAQLIVKGFKDAGYNAVMVGTGQTAWMQGADYSIILDSLINDFVSGEIENAVYNAWVGEKPDVIVIEGQGSLLNPAYPGGFEIMAAGRPDIILLQHAPGRKDYDGFPGYPLHPLKKQIQVHELISDKKVVGITINHEGLTDDELKQQIEIIKKETGLPTTDVLKEGVDYLISELISYINKE